MGLQAALGYQVTPANRAQRSAQRMAATPAGAWLFARTARHVDRALLRATRGRTTLAAVVAGVPVVVVASTGRRSGLRRTSPLLGIPLGPDLAIIGTNFGKAAMPSWYVNLAANPNGEVAYRDRTVPVVARDATDDERNDVLRAAAAIYPGYDDYQTRITGRTIPVLVLAVAPSDTMAA
jgi:deazaflavin-dependent oxidoreductase (nitroreductase family)